MTSPVFYRKWRPQTLAEVVGQEHVTTTLLNALRTGRVAHAYLFCGPRGTGKTSTGRILAKAVNCLQAGDGEPCNACEPCRAVTEGRSTDVIEVDAASNRGIDQVRDLREKVRFAPNVTRYKVYIVDEVHMLTEPAANALLKTLEEPPPYVIFVLATTEAHKVPATILSRCQRFDFKRVPLAAMVSRLEHVCREEGIAIDEPALKLIARSATGSMRDAENLLEQLVAYYGSQIGVNQAQAVLGVTGDVRARELARHALGGDVSAGLRTINSVSQDGLDLRQFTREMVQYLRELLLVKAGAEGAVELAPEALADMEEVAGTASMARISAALRLFRQVELEFDGFSTLPLELALVECALAADEGQAPSPPRARHGVSPPAADRPRERPATPGPVRERAREAAPPATPVPVRQTAPPAAPPATPPSRPTTPAPVAEMTPSAIPLPESADDVEYVRRRWNDVVRATKGMGSSGNLDALLRSACEPVALEDDTIVLGFYHDFHKERIEDPKYRHMVEQKVAEVLGKSYSIRCILTGKKDRGTGGYPQTPGNDRGTGGYPQTPGKDGGHGRLVDAALKMGARIVEEADE